ncbi:MAG: DUF4129 domain-containing protein [Mycobacterium sp.]
MFDKATGRVVAVIALLIVVAAALRGYLPGVEQASREEPSRSSASLVYVAALLSISLVIVGVAVIARLRDPRTRAASAGGLPDRFGGRLGRPGWRVLLIGAGVLVVWLLLVWLLTHMIVLHGVGQVPGGTESSTPTPSPANDTAPRPEPQEPNSDGNVLRYLVAGTVAMLLLIVASAVVGFRRRPRAATPPIVTGKPSEPPTPAAESLARAAEVGLAEIEDFNREPRAAIIACYAAMERELVHVPEAAPQDFDTPTEVLARAVEHHALHADNAARLVNLFEEARFSPHVMNEGHRETAVDVLQLVLAELRSVV